MIATIVIIMKQLAEEAGEERFKTKGRAKR